MKKILIVLVIGFGIYQWLGMVQTKHPAITNQPTAINPAVNSNQDNALSAAYQNRQSNVPVTGLGHVIRLLPDDNSGSRHQKFIVKLSSGQTILIVHNIDLAPRIDAIMAVFINSL